MLWHLLVLCQIRKVSVRYFFSNSQQRVCLFVCFTVLQLLSFFLSYTPFRQNLAYCLFFVCWSSRKKVAIKSLRCQIKKKNQHYFYFLLCRASEPLFHLLMQHFFSCLIMLLSNYTVGWQQRQRNRWSDGQTTIYYITIFVVTNMKCNKCRWFALQFCYKQKTMFARDPLPAPPPPKLQC